MGRPKKKLDIESMVEESVSELEANFAAVNEMFDNDERFQVTPEASPPKVTETDPGWHDYIISLLTPDELDGGNPTTDGLRRVAKLFWHMSQNTDIFESRIDFAAVKCTINATNRRGDYENPLVKVIQAVADAHNGSTNDPYARHMLATAETKAEGRALRKLLGLRRILCAEEAGLPQRSAAQNVTDACPPELLHVIGILASRANVNVIKLIRDLDISVDKPLTKESGDRIQNMLNAYANSSKATPESLIGFTQNWLQEIRT